MNKKVIKIISVIAMAIMLISVTFSTVIAAGTLEPNQITSDGWSGEGQTQIQTVGGAIVGVLQTVGVVISVVILIVLGIKYIMGSAEEKAEYKKTMIPYIIGAALIFMASVLAQVIFKFFTGINV